MHLRGNVAPFSAPRTSPTTSTPWWTTRLDGAGRQRGARPGEQLRRPSQHATRWAMVEPLQPIDASSATLWRAADFDDHRCAPGSGPHGRRSHRDSVPRFCSRRYTYEFTASDIREIEQAVEESRQLPIESIAPGSVPLPVLGPKLRAMQVPAPPCCLDGTRERQAFQSRSLCRASLFLNAWGGNRTRWSAGGGSSCCGGCRWRSGCGRTPTRGARRTMKGEGGRHMLGRVGGGQGPPAPGAPPPGDLARPSRDTREQVHGPRDARLRHHVDILGKARRAEAPS